MFSQKWSVSPTWRILAFPIGWDREKNARSTGLRTFPLVSMASCAYMLTGIEVLDSTEAEARVMYGPY